MNKLNEITKTYKGGKTYTVENEVQYDSTSKHATTGN